MSDSRRQILDALRAARPPFPGAEPPGAYRPVVPRAAGPEALAEQFALEAEKQAAQVHRAADGAQALEVLISLLEGQEHIAAWEPETLGLPALAAALQEAGIQIAAPEDETPEVGLTGALAGLAATGSLVLGSGSGTYRNTSLLPDVHIAVLREEQIVPDLESWFAAQREDDFARLRAASNVIVITGPSRTADIAMELVMGMHGPRELHVILVHQISQ